MRLTTILLNWALIYFLDELVHYTIAQVENQFSATLNALFFSWVNKLNSRLTVFVTKSKIRVNIFILQLHKCSDSNKILSKAFCREQAFNMSKTFFIRIIVAAFINNKRHCPVDWEAPKLINQSPRKNLSEYFFSQPAVLHFERDNVALSVQEETAVIRSF